MSNWKRNGSFVYERCIGFYYDGDTSRFLSIEDILYSESDSFSQEEHSGVYDKIDQNSVQLT